MRDANCIFCKIIGGEIPSNTIYEDDEFKVILDASPASKGHALILPKEHYADIYEIDEKTAGHAMQLAKKLAKHMTDVLKCDGFNIVHNCRVRVRYVAHCCNHGHRICMGSDNHFYHIGRMYRQLPDYS